MSLKFNTAANYIGQFYSSLIGIIIFPFYLNYLSPAAFGLLGLFTVLRNVSTLFDMGLLPAFSRQVALVRNQGNNHSELGQLLRSLEVIFSILGVLIGCGVCLKSQWLVHKWLKVDTLSFSEVSYCLLLITAMISLRLFSELYRSGIRGMEQQVWLNCVNIFIVTLQYLGGWGILHWVSQKPLNFFEYQLMISVAELLIIRIKFYKIIPSSIPSNSYISWKAIKTIVPIASSLAYTSLIWIILTQLDKLLLSSTLSLSTYGYYTLVIIISMGINQLSNPISQTILPRMIFLLSQNKEKELLDLYRKATQIMAVMILTIIGVTATFSNEVLYVWTNNKAAANWAAPILFWYLIGNAFLAFNAFQYYLQFTYGKLKLHVIYNTVFALISIPLIIYATFYYGAIGAAIVWVIMRMISFFLWTPYIHNKFAPGIHIPWVVKDILPIFLATSFLVTFIYYLHINFVAMSRWQALAVLIGIGLIVLIGNSLASSFCRYLLINRFLLYKKIVLLKALNR